jgi:hypothetical protein
VKSSTEYMQSLLSTPPETNEPLEEERGEEKEKRTRDEHRLRL